MVDYIEVDHVAHQLTLDHGRTAYVYADKVAAKAKRDGKLEEAEFWEAVCAAIRPRDV
jgi:hypothetical protein